MAPTHLSLIAQETYREPRCEMGLKNKRQYNFILLKAKAIRGFNFKYIFSIQFPTYLTFFLGLLRVRLYEVGKYVFRVVGGNISEETFEIKLLGMCVKCEETKIWMQVYMYVYVYMYVKSLRITLKISLGSTF